MRAAWLIGPRQLELRETELASPGSGQLRVAVAGCAVCGSNLHQWRRGPQGRGADLAVPGCVGHEVGGIVTATGDPDSAFGPGDVIAVEPSAIRGCHSCAACRDGASWFCAHPVAVPSFGFADEMLIPEVAAYAMPPAIGVDAVPLTEPIACGVHAIRHSWSAESGRIDGRVVAVIGAGMLGLAAAMAARHLGAAEIAVVARHPHQAAAAEAIGADRVLDSSSARLVKDLRQLRAGLVVEAAGGTGATLALATEVVAWRGEVVSMGGSETPQPIDVGRAVARETRVYFPVSYAALDGVHDFDVALELMSSGSFPIASLVTHRFGLDEINDAFSTADDKTSGAVRVVVAPR